MKSLLKKISAWLPIVMSLTALLWTIGYIGIIGVARLKASHDEGTGARVFQLLIVAQLPIILFFVFRWLQKKPIATLKIVALQILAILIAFVPVYLLEL